MWHWPFHHLQKLEWIRPYLHQIVLQDEIALVIMVITNTASLVWWSASTWLPLYKTPRSMKHMAAPVSSLISILSYQTLVILDMCTNITFDALQNFQIQNGIPDAFCILRFQRETYEKRWLRYCHWHDLWCCFIFRLVYLYMLLRNGHQRIRGTLKTTTSFKRWTPWTCVDKPIYTYVPPRASP